MKQYFKRSAAALLCLALLMGLFAGVPGALISNAVTTDELTVEEPKNLLADYNPSFEDYTIPNWTIDKTLGGVAQSKDKATDGNAWSLKINVNGANATSDAVAVTAGAYYVASAQVLGAGKLTVVFYDAAGAVLEEKSADAATTAWEAVTVKAAAPTAAAKAAVKLAATTAEAVYFDDASLKGAVPDVAAEITNADFQTGDNTGWNYSGTSEVVTEAGNSFYQLTTDNSKFDFKTDRFSIVNDVYYLASIKVKAGAAAFIQLYVEYWEAESGGSRLSADWNGYNVTTDGEWDTIVVGTKANANAKYANIRILSGTATTSTFAFDDAKMVACTSLVDGGFEGNADHQGKPMGLKSVDSAYVGKVGLNTDTSYVNGGVQSCYVNDSCQLRTYDMNIIPGVTYTATVDVKTPLTEGFTSNAVLYIYYYDVTGTQITSKYDGCTPSNSEWTTMTTVLVAPENATFARLMFQTAGGSECYFDNLTFTATPAEEMLTNADFETRTTGDKAAMTDWTSSKNTNWSLVEYVPGRGYVAHLDGADVGQQWLYSSTFGDVTPNAKYTLSVDVKTVASTTSWVMGYIEYLDESGTRCDGGYASVFSAKPESVDKDLDWTTFSGSLAAPGDAVMARTLIIVAGWYENSKNDAGDTVTIYHANQDAYIDNVVFSQVCEEHAWPETANSTTATCDKAGVETYICTTCGATGTKAAPATGHTYTDAADTTCDVCNASRIAISTNVVVGNNLDMLFGFDKTAVADWTGHKVKLTRTYADGTAADEKTYTVDQWSTDTESGKYYVTYDGLAFFHMGDEITVQVLDASNNVVSATWTDSIEKYALRRFAEDGASAELKAVLVEMLYFGAAAQEKFGYDTTNLVTADLTADHTRTEAATFENGLTQGDKFKASNLVVKSNIEFLVSFNGLTTDMSAEVTFTKWDGTTKVTETIAGSEFGRNGDYIFVTMPEKLSAADARQTITITIKNADGSVYATCEESIEAYLARQNDTNAVFAAFMKYADAANAYLSK